MPFPPQSPTLTQEDIIVAIAEAEAAILQCMADLVCNPDDGLFAKIKSLENVSEAVSLTKGLLCAYAAKEKAVGEVFQGLAAKILAEQGISPGGPIQDKICDP